ncbi:F-box/RNI-like superfamily protein [Perilla frutescens var. hirtella]|uniref:F-box/RNI-like superfamily protein n=1 Tax=Perilla frutescens var. hirtella TaxID=608512 RepID=A0AAD4IZD0_PERFH|nr:F-box/RNI-like superfamily protein [Perilla frutescens var. frutescens]KAH6824345.1 F-box/RNI-like superfamily protein [Perilla frutescens var. hirtella]
MAVPSGPARERNSRIPGLDHLPAALIATIMTKLDVPSILSLASTCRACRSCAAEILSFLPNFHLPDIAPSMDLLRPLLPPSNPYLRSMKVDCTRLDDSSIDFLLRPSLQELCLRNCADFSGKLLSELGRSCKELRFLYLSSVADKRGRSVDVLHLEEMLSGCTQLETLILMFDVSIFLRHNFARVWALASSRLISLEIEYISSVMVTELLSPAVGAHQSLNHPQPSILPNLQKLCLSVDYITDVMVSTISKCLVSLTHLDLRDIPIMEPRMALDLTNNGLQQINAHGKLKHLCLVRSQEIAPTFFRRVNDLGILLMADKCSAMESICLGGFCQVTDTGYKTLLHSCSKLYKLRVFHGAHLTDLVFHDIAATSLSLTHVSLRWCNLLTNLAAARLASNADLYMLDLRDCRNLGDEALRFINTLPKLKTLLLDGCDITDVGLSYLNKGVMNNLVSLSVRGCKRLTDRCISSLFDGNCNAELRELDLSNLPNLSDAGILSLARSRIPISELRLRQCPLIGDTSVMALASMQVDENVWCASSLRLLDIYNCGGITQLAFRWLKKPYFPRLRWLGVTGSMNRDIVDALARSRPYLHVTTQGEELGTEQWDNMEDVHLQDYDDVDELEEWLLGGNLSDDEMEDAVDMEDLFE